MSEIIDETWITLEDACQMIPGSKPGKHINRAMIYRWTDSGCRGVRLETVQVGSRRMTTPEAVRRFVAALSSPVRVRETKSLVIARCHSERAEKNRRKTIAAAKKLTVRK
jgi:hypothetical protein